MKLYTTIPQKPYRAVFFDWDGTAVLNRKASPEKVVERMRPLLKQGVRLIIISGTTWENIANGELSRYFTTLQLQNLYLGLGRGAYNFGFDAQGRRCLLHDMLPDRVQKLAIDTAAWEVHKTLFEQYGLCTDIVFSRPNYCKIDLQVENHRGEALYMQAGELAQLKSLLKEHKFSGGAKALIEMAENIARKIGQTLFATTDAKYLELGLSTKSHNVNYFMDAILAPLGIQAKECSFWGDEYRYIEEGVPGSDAYMLTTKTAEGDFFDVSGEKADLPEGVSALDGKIDCFLNFLETLSNQL